MHRGYLIEDLAEHSDFMDVCYLLLSGELPNSKEKTTFAKSLPYHPLLHEQMNYFFSGLRRDSHPMPLLQRMVGAMSPFYTDSQEIHAPHPHNDPSTPLHDNMPT